MCLNSADCVIRLVSPNFQVGRSVKEGHVCEIASDKHTLIQHTEYQG